MKREEQRLAELAKLEDCDLQIVEKMLKKIEKKLDEEAEDYVKAKIRAKLEVSSS